MLAWITNSSARNVIGRRKKNNIMDTNKIAQTIRINAENALRRKLDDLTTNYKSALLANCSNRMNVADSKGVLQRDVNPYGLLDRLTDAAFEERKGKVGDQAIADFLKDFGKFKTVMESFDTEE
jgi:hypothetical protein